MLESFGKVEMAGRKRKWLNSGSSTESKTTTRDTAEMRCQKGSRRLEDLGLEQSGDTADGGRVERLRGEVVANLYLSTSVSAAQGAVPVYF